MAKQPLQQAELSPAQRGIMEIVWELGEVSASQVCAILSKQRPVARNTARTMLERMQRKGWLTYREEGRTYLYSAAVPRRATIAQKVREVVDTVCGGSPETLVTALLDDRGLTDAELKRIRAMLDEASKSSRTRKG